MGWTMGWRAPGESNKEFFSREVLGSETRRRIVASRTLSSPYEGRVFYAAVEERDTREVWALVVLITGTPGTNVYGWKEMEESQGPAEDECPAAILDLLTPTESDHAQAWRERCRKRLEGVVA